MLFVLNPKFASTKYTSKETFLSLSLFAFTFLRLKAWKAPSEEFAACWKWEKLFVYVDIFLFVFNISFFYFHTRVAVVWVKLCTDLTVARVERVQSSLWVPFCVNDSIMQFFTMQCEWVVRKSFLLLHYVAKYILLVEKVNR